mmetsp:Transcript_15529/g.40161  ORF Transcript_15529/g.40161 Transcript_15529/m.40161 type:complete len:325 (-) Transcript_15529:184-1158(-)
MTTATVPAAVLSSGPTKARLPHGRAPSAAACAPSRTVRTSTTLANRGMTAQRNSSCSQRAAPQRQRTCIVQASADSETAAVEMPVPNGPEQTAQQALAACKLAYADGIRRQRVELLLPLIGATDLDDWPGGIQQQFKAVLPMVEKIMKGLKETDGLTGPLSAAIIDQGDAVGQWKGDKLGAIVFPTGQTLKAVKELAKNDSRLVLMINPQWQGGQIISDFGIGPWKKASEEFVESFEDVYYFKQTRITGDDCRVLRSYPGKWQVHVQDAEGNSPCVAMEDVKPSYVRLQEILQAVPGSKSSQTWDERLRSEFQFNNDSLKSPPQ